MIICSTWDFRNPFFCHMFPPAESPVYAPHSAVCVHLCPCSRPTLSLLTRHHGAAPSCWPDCTVPPAARDSINNDNYHSLEISGPQYTQCVVDIMDWNGHLSVKTHPECWLFVRAPHCDGMTHVFAALGPFYLSCIVLSALGVNTITVFTLVWWWHHPAALIGQSIRVQISSNHVR